MTNVNKVLYYVTDERGYVVDNYSFQTVSNGRGYKPTHIYMYQTGLMCGQVFYQEDNGIILDLIKYLKHMNDCFGLSHTFQINGVAVSNIIFNGHIEEEKIQVPKNANLLYVLVDENGNYVTQHSIQKFEDKVSYFAFSGRCDGMRYYDNSELAENMLDELNSKNKKYNLNHTFKIDLIDKYSLPLGIRVSEKAGDINVRY